MYQKILVPLDGSKRAEKILPHVEELASRYQATVTLLQIIPVVGNILTAGVITPLPDQLDSEKKLAESYLNGINAGLREKQIEIRTHVVVSGQVVDAIIQTAEEEKADLVAMSSHGHSGLSRVFYGSVAAGLLHRIDRPLLIIRSRKAE
jgi:nucleotide-binding universal stress UspA family protein